MGDDRRSNVEEVRERFERSAFHTSLLGTRLERVAEGEVDVALDMREHHRNLVGTLHGGVIATLADTATGLAYRTVLEPGTTHLTSSLSVTFLESARDGTVIARGRVVKRGRRFGYAEADVLGADGRLLARAAATFTVLPERTDQ
jgi:uncharacterized protein (TIGR00369 family)